VQRLEQGYSGDDMTILHTAQQYIQQKFSVVPIATDGTKQTIGQWKPYTQRYPSEHELQQWFGSQHPCGIGIPCGSISQNLVAIDFDNQAAEHYPLWMAEVQQQLPDVAQRLFIVETPRPGYHAWIRCETELPAGQVLAWTEPEPRYNHAGQPVLDADGNQVTEPSVLIELRSTGQYVVAAGSPAAVHPSGRPYRILQGSIDAVPVLPSDQVQQLLNIARSYSKWEPQQVQRKPGQPYRGQPRPGDIFNKLVDLRQLLLNHGWQLHHTVDNVDYLTRPGKPAAAGTSATLGALRSDDGKPLLYVFSDAAVPFRAGSAYDAFAVYSLLEHSGDFSTAAAAVRIRYANQVQAAQQEWQQANTVDSSGYVGFPTQLLPEAVQAYVLEHSQAIGIDPAFIAVPLLPVLAGLIGQARRLFIKRNWTEPSILWAVTVADVSTGKSPGFFAATAPAREIERTIHQHRKLAELQYQQALKEHQADKLLPKPSKPEISTQLTLDDISMESLTDVHSRNWHGMLLAVDELAGWLRSFDQYRAGKGRDVENWLSIYNGSSCQVNRKADNYRIYLPTTAISVCGTIQPEVAKGTLFSERFVSNGFAARILSAMPPAEIVRWTEAEVPEHVDTDMNRLAQRLYALTGEQGQERSIYLPFESEAKQLFIRYLNDTADHAARMEPVLRNAWLKLRPAAARFALVFSVVQQLHSGGHGTQPVDVQSTRAGIQLAWWFGKELERNYQNGMGTAADTMESHLAWIRRTHPAGIDVRQLQQGRRSIQTAEQARQVLQQMLDEGHGTLSGQLFIPK
jgi:hypothetical protein